LLSKAEVASSSTSIFGFFKNNLAIANLCFSPQLSFNHLSQIIVSSQFSNSYTKVASDFFKANSISFFVALGFAKSKLFLIVSLNKLFS
jgi:hypothetical protein